MKIKELREILIHFTNPEYDDFDIALWDYNNQRDVEWSAGMYAFSKPDKRLTFPVKVEPVDGVTIDERLKGMMEKVKNDTKPAEEDKPVEEDDEVRDTYYDARMFVRLLDIIKVWAGYDDRYGTTGDSEIDDDYHEVVNWLKSKESAIISSLKSKEE